MKKLILIIALGLLFTTTYSQVTSVGHGKTVIVSTFSISGLSGADTTFKFRMQDVDYWSMQIVLTDTIEGANAVGAYIYGSNDGVSWAALTDSLSFAVSTKPLGKFFTGTGFPYALGMIKINKNACTDGDAGIISYCY